MIKRLKENKRSRNVICPLIKLDALDSVGLKWEMEIAQEVLVDDVQVFVVESVCNVLGLGDCQHMDGKLVNGIGTLNYVCVEENETVETFYMNISGEEIEKFRNPHKRVVQYNIYLEADCRI